MIVTHSADLISKWGNLCKYSQEGLEANNRIHKMIAKRATDHSKTTNVTSVVNLDTIPRAHNTTSTNPNNSGSEKNRSRKKRKRVEKIDKERPAKRKRAPFVVDKYVDADFEYLCSEVSREDD